MDKSTELETKSTYEKDNDKYIRTTLNKAGDDHREYYRLDNFILTNPIFNLFSPWELFESGNFPSLYDYNVKKENNKYFISNMISEYYFEKKIRDRIR